MCDNPYRDHDLKTIKSLKGINKLLTEVIKESELELKQIDNGPFNHPKTETDKDNVS